MTLTNGIVIQGAVAALAALAARSTEAQQVVTPTKITAEAFLDQANDNLVRCGIHWANLVAQGNEVLAYQINIEGWLAPETKQSTTVVYASLRCEQKTEGEFNGNQANPDRSVVRTISFRESCAFLLWWGRWKSKPATSNFGVNRRYPRDA